MPHNLFSPRFCNPFLRQNPNFLPSATLSPLSLCAPTTTTIRTSPFAVFFITFLPLPRFPSRPLWLHCYVSKAEDDKENFRGHFPAKKRALFGRQEIDAVIIDLVIKQPDQFLPREFGVQNMKKPACTISIMETGTFLLKFLPL